MSDPNDKKDTKTNPAYELNIVQGFQMMVNDFAAKAGMTPFVPRKPFSFELDDDEAKKLLAWKAEHQCQFYGREDSYAGAIGGPFTYSFTPNGLGVVAVVSCGCGAKIDVTDYSGW